MIDTTKQYDARAMWLVTLTALDRARAKARRGEFTLALQLAVVDAEIAERQTFAALLRAKDEVS